MPKFNRERHVVEVLRKGLAPLTIRSWDTPGVLAAGRAFANALEHPAGMVWDAKPPSVDAWKRLIQMSVMEGSAALGRRTTQPEAIRRKGEKRGARTGRLDPSERFL